MTSISVFQFDAQQIRVVLIDDIVWFVAIDVAKVLQYADPSMMLKHVDDEDKQAINPQKMESVEMTETFGSNTFRLSVINESGMYAVIFGSTKPEAKAFKKWVTSEVLPQIRKTGSYSTEAKKALPEPVTDKTIAIHLQAITTFQDRGDLQLASLLKVRFGNLLLAEQQALPGTSEPIVQLESAVDVAIRLGIVVPKNYEGSLGKYVKARCGHLLQGKNNRYSSSSEKIVPANMYPANHPDVEKAVLEFAVSKSLTFN